MNSEDRKNMILEAAAVAFATHGYEKASIAVICGYAGIARPTLYQYFKDKNSLFRELVTSYLNRLEAYSHLMASDDLGLSPEEALYRKHLVIFREVLENRDIFRIIHTELHSKNCDTLDLANKFDSTVKATMSREIRMRVEQGLFHVSDVDFLVSFLFGAMSKLIEDMILNEKKPDIELVARKITDLQLTIFKSGII